MEDLELVTSCAGAALLYRFLCNISNLEKFLSVECFCKDSTWGSNELIFFKRQEMALAQWFRVLIAVASHQAFRCFSFRSEYESIGNVAPK